MIRLLQKIPKPYFLSVNNLVFFHGSKLHERAVKAQLHNTFLNRVGHPFTPPKKAIGQLKDFLTGDLTLSAGLDLQEFKDYVHKSLTRIIVVLA